MRTIELSPVNGRKSFYGKCKVNEKSNGDLTLLSYGTEVAHFNKENGLLLVNDKTLFTNTTMTHLRAFLDYVGEKSMTKKEVLNKIS